MVRALCQCTDQLSRGAEEAEAQRGRRVIVPRCASASSAPRLNEYTKPMRALTITLTLLAAIPAPAAEPFQFNPGDHVCIIGNATAYRMQFDGWLETFIHASLPKHNLVFRNLGFAGDELTVRLRSADFGTPDQWLTKCQADVIFAFFGFNESFAGEAGLPKFKKDLDDVISHTLAQKY